MSRTTDVPLPGSTSEFRIRKTRVCGVETPPDVEKIQRGRLGRGLVMPGPFVPIRMRRHGLSSHAWPCPQGRRPQTTTTPRLSSTAIGAYFFFHGEPKQDRWNVLPSPFRGKRLEKGGGYTMMYCCHHFQHPNFVTVDANTVDIRGCIVHHCSVAPNAHYRPPERWRIPAHGLVTITVVLKGEGDTE